MKTKDYAKIYLEKFGNPDLSGKPIFYSLSGAHLFGFPSKDSDWDIRGCFVVRTKDLLSLKKPRLVIEKMHGDEDLVLHEIEKYIKLIYTPNVNFIEQVNSPYEIYSRKKYHDKLKELSQLALTKEAYAHFSGFTKHTEHHAKKEKYMKIKRDLYLLRMLMQGINVLRTGKFESDIKRLNKKKYFQFPIVDELVELKVGAEQSSLKSQRKGNEVKALAAKLTDELNTAYSETKIKERPTENDWRKANNFLLKVRRDFYDY